MSCLDLHRWPTVMLQWGDADCFCKMSCNLLEMVYSYGCIYIYADILYFINSEGLNSSESWDFIILSVVLILEMHPEKTDGTKRIRAGFTVKMFSCYNSYCS